MKTNFYIGEVSQKTGLNPKTIRFWEQIGLFPKPARTKVVSGNGYRLYNKDDIQKLQFLKRTRLLELSTGEMKQLLEISDISCCPQVSPTLEKIVKKKSEEISQKIAELKKLQETLSLAAKNFQKSKKMGTNCIEEECL